MNAKSQLPELIRKHEKEILTDWLKEQLSTSTLRADLLSEAELKQQSKEFLNLFQSALQGGELGEITGPEWEETRDFLASLSRSRAMQGFTPAETATFVLSLKQPVFTRLQQIFADDPKSLAAELWTTTVLIDKLGLYTAETFIAFKEEVVRRQQDEMLELSTPVVKVWDQIIAVPLIGTLDSARTQVVMESLLNEIVKNSAMVAIIDITGVPTVDTLVAQHLTKTVAAARLMGAECVISGIRPQIAQTMVHLGVSMADIITKASLAEAIRYAFSIVGFEVIRPGKKA